MVLIEKTIYPRITKEITKNELIKYNTPSDEEVRFAYTYVKDYLKSTCF